MRLRYAYVPVLLLMSFSAMANVWASSFLSRNERDFRLAVSSDTVRGSRTFKQDSIFKTLLLGRALKKMPIFGKTNENVVSFYTCEQFSDIQIPSLF